jgi:CRISPR-associated protein Cas1
MPRAYYLIQDSRIRRKGNTIYIETSSGSKPIPVEDIECIYSFGETDFNTKLVTFLSQHHIPVHFFNYYGYYTGSFFPREHLNSGDLLIKQATHYLSKQRRLAIAREFVSSSLFNILKNLKYYNTRGKDLSEQIQEIESFADSIFERESIEELMAVEGNSREIYYNAWGEILNPPEGEGFEFNKRVRQPPDNAVNALISFCNSLVYTAVLSEIYQTPLSPLISYLHEPGERRFSLSLDISEIFKPIFADRIIFKLINNGELRSKHFDKNLKMCLLNDEGRKIVLREFDEKMRTTIKHRKLGRNVSYKRLIRIECYKLMKHLLNESKYQAFKIWW